MKFSRKVGNGQLNKIKFWWRSGSGIRIRIATLVRRALADVCTVPVLLVNYLINMLINIANLYKSYVI